MTLPVSEPVFLALVGGCLALVVTVVGIAGALGGTWLGSRLSWSIEERNWRRQHCLDAYAEVLTLCQAVVSQADKLYGYEAPSQERLQQQETLLKMVDAMYGAADRATLLGPREIHEPLNALVYYYGKSISGTAFASPRVSAEEWKKIRTTDAVPIYLAFLMAARNDLGIYPKLYRPEGPTWVER